jgi:hypothetical protein
MQEMRAEFDEQSWPVGYTRTQDLDTEVLGFEQETLSTPGPVREHLGHPASQDN